MASPIRQTGPKRHHKATWPDMFANLQTAYAELTRAQFELERRVVENEAERDLFLQVMTSMSEALFLMDRTGRVIRINPTVSNLFEGNEAELVGRPFGEVCGSDEIPATPWQLLKRAPSGRLSHVDIEISTRLGHIIPVSISMALVRDRQGKITGMQAVMRDITERNRAEEKFRAAVEAAPNAMIMVNQEGEIALANLQAEALFGYPRQELIGQPVDILVPDRFRNRHPEYRTAFFADPRVRPMGAGRDLYGLHKDGREIPVEIGLNPLVTGEGPFVLAAIIDITERKRAEEALHRAHDELEMRVSERTAELARANTDLRDEIARRLKAETRMKASLQQQDTLLKEIHHRVKNNLQIISSLLNLQARYITDPRALQVFNNSQNRVKSMGLIHQILYQENNISRIDFAQYIRHLMSYLFHSHGVSSTNITFKIISRDVKLSTDIAISCGLIINELVSNSLRHAFPEKIKGEVRIELRMNKNQVDLVVCDNGIGFPKNFDIRNSQSLGLKLVLGLVNQLGGTINFDSNSGARFSITFIAEDF